MPQFPDTVSSQHLFDAHITLATPANVGAGPRGTRTVHIVERGTFDGPRLRGTFHAGGGDWLLTSGGYNELDVRATLETHDGALIYLFYHGVLNVEPAIAVQVMSGADIDPATYYFRTTPRFETGHDAYAWLNSTITVAYGYFGPGKVGYRVFAIE